jgi:hypothetical protein
LYDPRDNQLTADIVIIVHLYNYFLKAFKMPP